VEERGQRDQYEAGETQARHDQHVELDETRALAPFRFGGIE